MSPPIPNPTLLATQGDSSPGAPQTNLFFPAQTNPPLPEISQVDLTPVPGFLFVSPLFFFSFFLKLVSPRALPPGPPFEYHLKQWFPRPRFSPFTLSPLGPPGFFQSQPKQTRHKHKFIRFRGEDGKVSVLGGVPRPYQPGARGCRVVNPNPFCPPPHLRPKKSGPRGEACCSSPQKSSGSSGLGPPAPGCLPHSWGGPVVCPDQPCRYPGLRGSIRGAAPKKNRLPPPKPGWERPPPCPGSSWPEKSGRQNICGPWPGAPGPAARKKKKKNPGPNVGVVCIGVPNLCPRKKPLFFPRKQSQQTKAFFQAAKTK